MLWGTLRFKNLNKTLSVEGEVKKFVDLGFLLTLILLQGLMRARTDLNHFPS